jgi:hypothetical protein
LSFFFENWWSGTFLRKRGNLQLKHRKLEKMENLAPGVLLAHRHSYDVSVHLSSTDWDVVSLSVFVCASMQGNDRDYDNTNKNKPAIGNALRDGQLTV